MDNINIDPKALEAAKKGDKNSLINSLSEEEKAKLNAVLNDKQALAEALKSPIAKMLMKKFLGGGNNG